LRRFVAAFAQNSDRMTVAVSSVVAELDGNIGDVDALQRKLFALKLNGERADRPSNGAHPQRGANAAPLAGGTRATRMRWGVRWWQSQCCRGVASISLRRCKRWSRLSRYWAEDDAWVVLNARLAPCEK
jgi:hypothetical protein